MKNLRLLLGILIIFAVSGSVVFAQDVSAMLESYSRNFEKSDINAKLVLIEDAAKQNKEGLAPLFKQAVDYAVNVSFQGMDVSVLRQICLVALNQIEAFGYQDARGSVWKLFMKDVDSNIRIQSLKALSVAGKGDRELAGFVNEWLAGQNTIFKSGRKPNNTVIAQCVITLGALDQDSSFTVVFNTMTTGYSNDIEALCKNVLINLNGEFKQLLLDVINQGTMLERREALDVALESKKLGEPDKGEIAETAFEVALKLASKFTEENREIRQMRLNALRALSECKRSSATPLVLHYFQMIHDDYAKNVANKTELIDCIRGLANMGNNESAVRLSSYLDELNIFTEKKKVYDEQIVIEVVQALGRMQDKVAFDYLMRVKFLNYSNNVRSAADEAIKNLKW